MDVEKSRKFYQDRYYKALQQFGKNSLTASICKKKLELLGEKIKQLNSDNNSVSDPAPSTNNTPSENQKESKEKLETDD